MMVHIDQKLVQVMALYRTPYQDGLCFSTYKPGNLVLPFVDFDS